ncbi:MAG TPA: choice-of-anchor B family protein, partial [Thermoanaerobaculia bacterium]|nr:choice-of-anchor B family protein [Thermoanaerobaculia bacterium]
IHDTQCVIYRGTDQRFAGRELCFASGGKSFSIIDVTDKAAPRLLSRNQYEGAGYSHQGALTEDHRQFLMDDEFDERQNFHNTRTYLWNLADLTGPEQFAHHDHASGAIDHDQYVHQGHVYQGNYRAGLRILDLAKVGQGKLTEVGYFDIVPENDDAVFDGAWGAYPYFRSGTILVPGLNQGLYLLRRSGAIAPTGPCKASAQVLCLASRRFQVEVDWNNQFDGSSGKAKAVQGGFFTFGDSSNVELMVKILDDGSHYQLYYGQLTNLGFSLRVTDTETGQVRFFSNGPNNCGGVAELAPSDGHGHDASRAPVWLGPVSEEVSLAPAFAKKGTCKSGKDGLCLNGNRYLARVTWRNQFNGASGIGKPKPISGVTGSFAFTSLSNPELLVKVLGEKDGRTLVIWGAMSNLEYTLEVTDTKTGKVKTYHNPAGRYCGGWDEF